MPLYANPTVIGASLAFIATLILARLTFLYLRETKEMRKIAYKSLQVDAKPKVFVDQVRTHQRLILDKQMLEIAPICFVTNVGKTEAKKPQVMYTISLGDKVRAGMKLAPAPHIFPTQKVSFRTIGFQFKLDDRQFENAKGVLQLEKEERKVLLPQNFAPTILLNLLITYLDHNKKPMKVSYLCEYRWNQANWGIAIPEKEPSFQMLEASKE